MVTRGAEPGSEVFADGVQVSAGASESDVTIGPDQILGCLVNSEQLQGNARNVYDVRTWCTAAREEAGGEILSVHHG